MIEALFSWFLLFSIGVSYLYNAVFHIFFGEMTAPDHEQRQREVLQQKADYGFHGVLYRRRTDRP